MKLDIKHIIDDPDLTGENWLTDAVDRKPPAESQIAGRGSTGRTPDDASQAAGQLGSERTFAAAGQAAGGRPETLQRQGEAAAGYHEKTASDPAADLSSAKGSESTAGMAEAPGNDAAERIIKQSRYGSAGNTGTAAAGRTPEPSGAGMSSATEKSAVIVGRSETEALSASEEQLSARTVTPMDIETPADYTAEEQSSISRSHGQSPAGHTAGIREVLDRLQQPYGMTQRMDMTYDAAAASQPDIGVSSAQTAPGTVDQTVHGDMPHQSPVYHETVVSEEHGTPDKVPAAERQNYNTASQGAYSSRQAAELADKSVSEPAAFSMGGQANDRRAAADEAATTVIPAGSSGGKIPPSGKKQNVRKEKKTSAWVAAIAVAFAALIALTFIYTNMIPRDVNATINGEPVAITTKAHTMKELLKEQGISYCEADYISVPLSTYISEGMAFELDHASSFKVTADGKTKSFKTLKETVGEALTECGIKVGDKDIVEPSSDTVMRDDLDIVVKRVKFEEKTVEEKIDFKTVTKEDSSLDQGKTKVVTKGKKGKARVTYRIKYIDGKESSKKKLSRKVVKKPVDKVVAKGTRFVFDGSSYSRKLTVKAYAYTGGGRTAMGTAARVGEIAVDPSVIPLGSTVYIEGVGERRAEDTGGNIKGNTIDIYMNSEAECRSWGVRYLTIYIK